MFSRLMTNRMANLLQFEKNARQSMVFKDLIRHSSAQTNLNTGNFTDVLKLF
jgi:hypothetical protein